MKKTTIRIAAAFAACTMTVSAVSATAMAAETEPVAKYLLGDVSMNGKIDLEDVNMLIAQYTFSTLLQIDSKKEENGLFNEMQNILGDIGGNDLQPESSPYPGYTNDYGDYIDTRVSLYDVFSVLEYYAQKELLGNADYTWAEFGKEVYSDDSTALDRMMSVDRGDYELRWDDEFGDYVVALKG